MIVTNGRVPISMMTEIGGGRYLVTGAALAWRATQTGVARRFGWTPQLSAGASAYRSVEAQTTLFLARYTTNYAASSKRDRRYWQGKYWWRKPGYYSAATPGTSNHGYGIAIDVSGLGGFTSTRYLQFVKVAAQYGFDNSEGRSIDEYWHWVWDQETKVKIGEEDMTGVVHDLLNYRNPIDRPFSVYGYWIDASEKAFGNLTVRRGGQDVPALQELADTKTVGLDIQRRVIALEATVTNLTKALANVSAAGGQPFDEARLLEGIQRTVEAALAEGVDVNVSVNAGSSPTAV